MKHTIKPPKKTEKDPDGGPFPAYPSGKSWDEASGKTGSGKKFYHNIIPGSQVKTQPFYVAIITPVIHYCMGGLEIDTDSAVVNAAGEAISGLYAAGEVAGGVHGNNRLGGNSLLDCVVFGRVAGKACAKFMLGDDLKETDLSELSGGGLSGSVEGSKLSGGSYEDSMNKSAPLLGAPQQVDLEAGKKTAYVSSGKKAILEPPPHAPIDKQHSLCWRGFNDCKWCFLKFDGVTWGLFLGTVVFLLLVYLSSS